MTLAELRSWMRHRNRGTARRQRLERYLQRYQLIYANDDLCELWAQATDSARRHARPHASAGGRLSLAAMAAAPAARSKEQRGKAWPGHAAQDEVGCSLCKSRHNYRYVYAELIRLC